MEDTHKSAALSENVENPLEKKMDSYKQYLERSLEREARLKKEKLELLEKLDEAQADRDLQSYMELERRTLYERLASTNDEYNRAMEELEKTRQSLDVIRNSHAWRITAPLRRWMDRWKERTVRAAASAVKAGQALSEAAAESTAAVSVPPLPVKAGRKKKRAPVLPEPSKYTDPALCLPESLFHNREEISAVVDKLSQYDMVSFDIFDTLVFRVFDEPADVFRYLGHKLGEESFAKLRIRAEQEAREKKKDGNVEVTIFEIYEVLSRCLPMDPQAAIEAELQAEMECCYANPYLKEVFDRLVEQGTTVVLTSDMYWPENYMRRLLDSCGYRGYHGLFVSCDYGCGKNESALQQIVDLHFPQCGSVIHVGDNRAADIRYSYENGWDTMFYQSCREMGGSLRSKDTDRLTVSAYNALVNQHLHADSTMYSPFYEHGFRYAGFPVCGFCEWLNKYVKANNIDRILFLARDCDVIKKVYDRYYKTTETRYAVVSRLALWEMAFEDNPEDFIQNFFYTRACQGNQRIGDALDETDLAFLNTELQEEKSKDLTPATILNTNTYEAFREFLYDHYEQIAAHYAQGKEAGLQYFSDLVGDAKRVCAVDIGWSGQILLSMRKLFRKHFQGEVSLQGAYMALTNNRDTSGFVENGILSAYLFQPGMNQDTAIRTATSEGDMQAKFTEATFTSEEATLLKYDRDPEGGLSFLYGIPNTNPVHVRQMQQGILDFAEQWNKRVRSLPTELSIVPTDAKRILDQAILNYRYCYAIFKDNKEWEFALPNFKGQGTITTLGEMLMKRNMV